jgi:hypothetical protein
MGALVLLLATLPADGQSAIQWNGFALIRTQTPAAVPLNDDAISAQVQIGLDWRPSPAFGAHVHLLARNENDESRRGHAGVVEAFVEANHLVGRDRIRVLAGAFFLPTSRENIDSLWETPYTITSSALNSWFGEEFRPIGIDLSYRKELASSGITAGATVYRGNDTFGAFPFDRGWAIHDRWALLGEHLKTNDRYFTSVSAELDGRLGWSARGKWNNRNGAIQYTRIDNRSDALLYGDLFNWATRFNIVGGDYTWRNWTVAGELGWGTTAIQRTRGRSSSPIHASYFLVSKKITPKVRASLRADAYKRGRRGTGDGLTAALFYEPHPRLRAGIEGITAEGERSLAVEMRYRF